MFDLLMKRQGQRLLREAGWPARLKWQWRLSNSQGDGCALYGWLHRDQLLTQLPSLTQRQSLSAGETQHLTTLLTLYDITVVLQRNALSARYCHAGCITPVVEGFPHGEFPAYTSFCLALQQDIRDLCLLAEQTGYRLLDATTPRSADEVLFSRQTRHLEVRAVADMPDVSYSTDHTDDDALDICLERLLLHRARLLTVRLEVICHTTGDILTQQWLTDVLIEPDDKPRRWLDRDTLHALTTDAREAIRLQTDAFHSFHRAA